MKTIKTLVLTMITAVMIATLAVTAGPVSAVESIGPYYATPAWDQKLPCPTTDNCPRFIVLSNWTDPGFTEGVAVLDRETGLVWQRSPNKLSKFPWEDASISCVATTIGGRLGWRLATIQELASLVEPFFPFPSPSLPPGHPFLDVQRDLPYWSATTQIGFPGTAYTVGFDLGNVSGSLKSVALHFWCVRGGHGVDPQ